MDQFASLRTAWERLERRRDEVQKQRERIALDLVEVLEAFLGSLDPTIPPFHVGGQHPRYNSVAGYVNLRTNPFIILHDYVRVREPKPELLFCPVHTINRVSTTKRFIRFHPVTTCSGYAYTEWATDEQLRCLEFFDLSGFIHDHLRVAASL